MLETAIVSPIAVPDTTTFQLPSRSVISLRARAISPPSSHVGSYIMAAVYMKHSLLLIYSRDLGLKGE
jgi:hypothetical protein